MNPFFLVVTPAQTALFLALFFLIFLLLVLSSAISWHKSRLKPAPSPYTGLPLRRATDLSFFHAEKTLRYLYDLKQYDNRIFNLKKAALCRDTGRIFPDSVNWLDVIAVDWSFISKRYSGHFVSWGSLTPEKQREIKEQHYSLEGFQTEFSCPHPSPQAITPEYAYTKPGPLYVDVETKVLMGWKLIPNLEIEVLIVQKPIDHSLFMPKIPVEKENLKLSRKA